MSAFWIKSQTQSKNYKNIYLGEALMYMHRFVILMIVPIGFILYFYNFSSWEGKGLYIEDFYLKPEYRGLCIVKNIMAYLAKIAKDNDCKRFEWIVLDWNESSINLYKEIGALPMDDWTIYRLSGNKLDELARNNKMILNC